MLLLANVGSRTRQSSFVPEVNKTVLAASDVQIAGSVEIWLDLQVFAEVRF